MGSSSVWFVLAAQTASPVGHGPCSHGTFPGFRGFTVRSLEPAALSQKAGGISCTRRPVALRGAVISVVLRDHSGPKAQQPASLEPLHSCGRRLGL